jgi:hypothetical protein
VVAIGPLAAARLSAGGGGTLSGCGQVSVEFQLNSIYNVVEKSQQLNADFMLISSWSDSRCVPPRQRSTCLGARLVGAVG